MWFPDRRKVSAKEIVGRRAFGSKVFTPADCKGVKGAPGGFRINVFYEQEQQTDLSLDRLGLRETDPEVLAYLHPVCRNHAERRGTTFICWAAILVSALDRETLEPSPIEPDKNWPANDENPFHCDLKLDVVRDSDGKIHPALMENLAFKLAVLAFPVWPASRDGHEMVDS